VGGEDVVEFLEGVGGVYEEAATQAELAEVGVVVGGVGGGEVGGGLLADLFDGGEGHGRVIAYLLKHTPPLLHLALFIISLGGFCVIIPPTNNPDTSPRDQNGNNHQPKPLQREQADIAGGEEQDENHTKGKDCPCGQVRVARNPTFHNVYPV
jgi:hypothetical protein